MNVIMSDLNGHKSILVKKITRIGNDPTRFKRFTEIIYFLAIQYIDELDEGVNPYSMTTDEFYEKHSFDFLTFVCDDNDLRTIIQWCEETDEEHEDILAEKEEKNSKPKHR